MLRASKASPEVADFSVWLTDRNPHEPEFCQAVQEAAADVLPFLEDHPEYREADILPRLTEPDRIIIFRVVWEDDLGRIRVNRGYRVQHSNAVGPYKGGIRFHPEVNLSVLKFLAFEQTLKNSLTGLPLGGGKGGADFDPKGRSRGEVMRFCQSYMTELYRHIGPYTDVPAGDIGVGTREVSFLFGQYKRLSNQFTGALTGKGLAFGGSEIRIEATGYGCVYMMEDMLQRRQDGIEGKTALLSGAGNVALHVAEKLLELGGRPVTLSDSSGFIYDPAGITREKLAWVKQLKQDRSNRISAYAAEFGASFHRDQRPWRVSGQLAFPCATQNELSEQDARDLIANGCIGLAEGANMPCEQGAIDRFLASPVLFAPSKAANAGGVAVSALEMTQNSMRLSWSRDELNRQLRTIMRDIHDRCVEYGAAAGGTVNYSKGANIAGFVKVADALLAYGTM